MRRFLAETLQPPQFTTVWFARHRGISNFGANVAQLQSTRADDRWDTTEVRRVLICTLAFRGLAVAVRTDSDWGVTQMSLSQRTWTRIWPAEGTVQWPPQDVASDADVQAVAGQHSGWIHLPEGRFERNLDGWIVHDRN